MFFKEVHEVAVYDVFHHLAADRGQENWSVV
jgi:hypothetical protein